MSGDLESLMRERLREATQSLVVPTTEIVSNVTGRFPAARRARRMRRLGWVATPVCGLLAVGAIAGIYRVEHRAPVPALLAHPAPTRSAMPATVACPASRVETVHELAHLEEIQAAYLCGPENRTEPDGSVWNSLTVRRVTGGLPALLAAYATPNTATPNTAPTNRFCALPYFGDGAVWLHTTKRVVTLTWPVNDCGSPQHVALAARSALESQVVSEQKLNMVSSPLAATSGCPQSNKDMLVVEGSARPGVSPTALTWHAGAVLCRYTIGVGSDPTLAGARALSAADLAAINAALAESKPDPACRREAGQSFAVITLAHNEQIYVSLDGCAVLQRQNWWRASNQLRILLK